MTSLPSAQRASARVIRGVPGTGRAGPPRQASRCCQVRMPAVKVSA
ncbi:hypothetical protein [Micromonospora deserti]|nr:hypothetical protein [Micromonospora deserti]